MAHTDNRETSESTRLGFARRAVAVTAIGLLVFALLWLTIFSAVTAAVVASGGTAVVIVATSASNAFETALEFVWTMLSAFFSSLAAFIEGIFS